MLVKRPFAAYPKTFRTLKRHLLTLLNTCNALKNLTQIHTQIIANGFASDSFILVKLLSVYISSGRFEHASRAFEELENPSTSAWNQMISGHGRSSAPWKSIETFNRMVVAEAEPDEYTYSYLLSACVGSGLFREGLQVHGKVLRNGYFSNVFMKTKLVNLYGISGGECGMKDARKVFDESSGKNAVCWNTLLAGYIRCRDIDGARRLFDEMPERNVVSWTIMTAGYAKNGMCRQALCCFNEMRRARLELDQVALISALSACAELGNLKLGKWIHSYIVEKICVRNQELLVSLNNALIHMYASCGLIDEAYEIFRTMPRRSAVSWTTMISGFAKQGLADEALGIYYLMLGMEENGEQPDELTYIGVLSACSHAGYVDKGRSLFESMSASRGIEHRIEHYGCMVDLLSRAGYLEEASQLIATMPMKPNDAVWGALLNGCRIHKNSELASLVAQELMVELDTERAAGYLLLLLEIHGYAKRWDDVNDIRQKMIDIRARKPTPGRSWVQVNGIVHDFVSGDRTHKHTCFIYDMLSLVKMHIEWDGAQSNVPDTFLYTAA